MLALLTFWWKFKKKGIFSTAYYYKFFGREIFAKNFDFCLKSKQNTDIIVHLHTISYWVKTRGRNSDTKISRKHSKNAFLLNVS